MTWQSVRLNTSWALFQSTRKACRTIGPCSPLFGGRKSEGLGKFIVEIIISTTATRFNERSGGPGWDRESLFFEPENRDFEGEMGLERIALNSPKKGSANTSISCVRAQVCVCVRVLSAYVLVFVCVCVSVRTRMCLHACCFYAPAVSARVCVRQHMYGTQPSTTSPLSLAKEEKERGRGLDRRLHE